MINPFIKEYFKNKRYEKNFRIETEEEIVEGGINLIGYVNSEFGLGRTSRCFIDAIQKSEIPINIIEKRLGNKISSNHYKTTNKCNYSVNIHSYNPTGTKSNFKELFKNRYNIGIWFFELETLPQNWKKLSEDYDEIWATTTFLEEVFKKELPGKKIRKINHPLTPIKKLDKNESKSHFGIGQDEFVCLFIFDFNSDFYRKNPLAVIDTFQKAFKNEKVRLVIKSHSGTASQVNLINQKIKSDSRIIHYSENWESNEVNILMNACDVYISIHRSEGLGLTMLEAIALEKPVLCTNYSGNLDFCKEEWSELVDYEMVKVHKQSDYFKYYGLDSQEIMWAEPNIKDASSKLTKIYHNYSDYELKAKIGSKWVLENYSTDTISSELQIINENILKFKRKPKIIIDDSNLLINLEEENKIPKIVHLSWKDNNLDQQQSFILERWKYLHPNCKFMFWTDADNEKLIEEFPQYKEKYYKLPTKIQKLDLLRLLYLYKYGGVYTDLDVLPIKSLEPILNCGKSLVLCEDLYENAKKFNVEKIVSNHLIISTKENKFIKIYIESILKNSEKKINNFDDILKTSGPLLLTDLFNNFYYKSSFLLLDSFYFNPLSLEKLAEENLSSEYAKFSFGVHLYNGSWWKKEDTIKNFNYIKSLINLAENNYPLISCLCITKNKKELVEKSIKCFNKQIYPNKELILIYEKDNPNINFFNSINQKNIIKIEVENRTLLGNLRNMSIEVSNGEYIAQWDDDDIYCPSRIYHQYTMLKSNNKKGSILTNWIIYNELSDELYLSIDRNYWEGSLLYKKSEIFEKYKDLKQSEDTCFIEDNKIFENCYLINKPELYLYRIHDNNTWDKKHFNKILNESFKIKKLRKIDGISFCISTNGSRINKTILEIKSIKNTMKNTGISYEIIVIGNINLFKDIKNITLIEAENEANNGLLSTMRNLGGCAAKYNNLVFCDDDLIFDKQWCTKFVDFSKNNDWEILGNRILLPDGGRYWDRATYNPHQMIDYESTDYKGVLYQTGCFWIIKKDVFQRHRWDESIKYYNEKENKINEDVEYSIRLQKNGYEIKFDKENLIWHNDDSYIDIITVCMKKEELTEEFGIQNFLKESEEFKRCIQEI